MRILIGTDGSATSHLVQEEVASRSWPLGTEVLVLRCVDSATYPYSPSLVTLAMEGAREELEASVESLNECAGLHVSTLVAEGHPAKTIVARAEEWGADFIFLGSHGIGPVSRFLLGSTVTTVLHHAPCAIEIVRHPRADRQSHADGRRRILLATDGSACSEKAVESVAARPWPAGSAVRVISVPAFSGPRIEPGYMDMTGWAEVREIAVDDANRAASEALARLKGTNLAADTVVPSGLEGAKAAILDEAERWQANLIVAGSHGHGRLDRFLLGSVSETLALYASCSVEVFREKQVRFEETVNRIEAGYIRVAPVVSGGA